ncbi:MAG: transporter, partial [Candidatus Omnitrophica bacterium]|nr:transporter [Candidatus Omnitrophota bacterium]
MDRTKSCRGAAVLSRLSFIFPLFLLIFAQDSQAQLSFTPVVGSSLGFFDPIRNVGFNDQLTIQQTQVGGGVGSSVATVGSQAAFSSVNRRSLDEFDLVDIEDNMGALYSEPAWTLGKGKHSVGFGYSYYHYTQYNGQDLDDLFDASLSTILGSAQEDTDFELDAHVWTMSYGKGITDDLDVYFVIPFIALDGEGGITETITGEGPFGGLDPGVNSDSYSRTDSGIGDVMMRLKYAVCKDEESVLSIGGDLLIPTGDEDKYLGGGDFGYRIRTLYSKKVGRFYPTIELAYFWTPLDGTIQATAAQGIGIPVPNLDEGDYDAFEYRVGLPYLCNEKTTLSVEWIGSISDAFTQNDLGFSGRFDMAKIKEGLVLDAGFRVPIDDDGLRTDVT